MAVLLVIATAGAGGGGRAQAEEVETPAKVESPAPRSSLLDGPSLYETGRVGAMTVSDPGSRIEQTAPHRAPPREMVVQPAAIESESTPVAPPPSTGFINASVLAREVGEKLAALDDCRIGVARRQQLAWNQVVAGRLTLGWTILPTGAVAAPEVVPMDPIDLYVLDCVKQQMLQWVFSRPRGGPMRLSQPFAFR